MLTWSWRAMRRFALRSCAPQPALRWTPFRAWRQLPFRVVRRPRSWAVNARPTTTTTVPRTGALTIVSIRHASTQTGAQIVVARIVSTPTTASTTNWLN